MKAYAFYRNEYMQKKKPFVSKLLFIFSRIEFKKKNYLLAKFYIF